MAKRQIHRIDLTIEETDGAWHVWRWASDVNGVDIPDYDFHCPCYPDKEGAVYDAIYTAKTMCKQGMRRKKYPCTWTERLRFGFIGSIQTTVVI